MAWSAKPTAIEKNEDGTGLVVTVEVTDGAYTETLTRPLFRPKSDDELDTACQNLIAEVQARKEAIAATDAVYKSVSSKKLNVSVAQVVEVIKK